MTPRQPDRDGIAVARLTGAAHYARTQHMTTDQSVAHLRDISTRPDLLAQAAGILAGGGKVHIGYWPWALADARLLVQAGADRTLLPRWIRQGIENVERSKWRPGAAAYRAPDELVDAVLAEVLDGLPATD